MALVREDVKQEDWEYFNSLNIQFEGKHITADKYSTWVVNPEREVFFTTVCWGGRDYGDTYILIWGQSRIYVYVEARPTRLANGTREFCWLIEKITAPLTIKDKRDELINLIKEVADINYDRRSSAIFVITRIAEPEFIEGV